MTENTLSLFLLCLGIFLAYGYGYINGRDIQEKRAVRVAFKKDANAQRLVGKYLCYPTDPLSSVFLVTEYHSLSKLNELVELGVFRQATEREITEANKSFTYEQQRTVR